MIDHKQPSPQRYEITEDIVKMFEDDCIRPNGTCMGCQYAGTGSRKGCCDLSDSDLIALLCSRPLLAAPENKIGFTSSEIIHLAENDWHCREERRNIHPMIPWTQGWITGFLTPSKPDWIRIKKDAIAAQAIASLPKEMAPGCYATCPFDDLCANDVEKIKAIEDMAAAQARAEVLEIEKAWRNDPHPSRDILNPFREICVQCVKDIGYEDTCCDPSECVADAQVESLRQAGKGDNIS